jgi:hypothetical protein
MMENVPNRLEKLRARFLSEATSKEMIDELDDIISDIRLRTEGACKARQSYRVDL